MDSTADASKTTVVNELIEILAQALHEEEATDGIIGPSVRRMVKARSHELLDRVHQEMGIEHKGEHSLPYASSTDSTLAKEFETVLGQVQRVVSERIESGLFDIVIERKKLHQEMERARHG